MKENNLIYKELVESKIDELKAQRRFFEMKKYIQHGNTTVFEHSYKVALLSCKISNTLRLKVNHSNLIKGAMLHDYFLYDWHDTKNKAVLHGINHPKVALKNAKEDFEINRVEEDIILRHMFPLNPLPPRYLESWVVCVADKISAVTETISPIKIYYRNTLIFCNKIIFLAKNLIIS
ncbi:HD domain-containing protein [Anaerosphaera multitolerans]|uniref:HD domain-containing protein n=1 Tax=Anaerosphaera multitolerans TaxID=2487351 RepID=A0A437S637_9FIRM|nr:HD domain-containing protein [Anaerosphaera multitolerans]RVU54481.1 HD domain-containing protein [Anaerosphaera multitolerans]